MTRAISVKELFENNLPYRISEIRIQDKLFDYSHVSEGAARTYFTLNFGSFPHIIATWAVLRSQFGGNGGVVKEKLKSFNGQKLEAIITRSAYKNVYRLNQLDFGDACFEFHYWG